MNIVLRTFTVPRSTKFMSVWMSFRRQTTTKYSDVAPRGSAAPVCLVDSAEDRMGLCHKGAIKGVASCSQWGVRGTVVLLVGQGDMVPSSSVFAYAGIWLLFVFKVRRFNVDFFFVEDFGRFRTASIAENRTFENAKSKQQNVKKSQPIIICSIAPVVR